MGAARQFVKILAINTAFAFIPPILLLVMSLNAVPLSRLSETFLFSLVYSHCIGGLCFATIPWLWCAAQGLNRWLQWPLRVGMILGNTVVGSLLACSILVVLGWMPRELYWPEFWGSLKIAAFISILAG